MPRFHKINGTRVQYTTQEETARDSEEQAWNAGANARAATSAREERNVLLAQTDWMANSDVTMTDAWAAYRVALRNIPAQGGFPTSITWPTEPS